MTAALLDGRALAKATNAETRAAAESLARPPCLVVVLVGEDPASQVYVRRKGEVAERIGFAHREIRLPDTTTQSELDALIGHLSDDALVDGILVQLPLPPHLDATRAVERIDPRKDVDGLTAINAGRLALGRPGHVPCTPAGVMRLLATSGVSLRGARAVVLGRSNIVGRPMVHLLEQADATVTLAHSKTRDLPGVVRGAEVVIAAVGRPRLVTADWVAPGAVVIDVGINRLPDGTLCGDVDTDDVARVARAITPAPGGVGPMTIAMLMANTLAAARAR